MFFALSRRSALVVLMTSALVSPALAEPVTIEVASWKGNEAEPAGMAELIAKFEAEHPEIKVNLVYVSRNDTDTVVSPRVRGDNPPDVIMTDPPLLRQWGEAGLLTELDKGTWFERIPENLRVAVAIDDKAYVFPLEVIGIGNFVNMGLLRKVGIETPPTTIDALKVACGKLADAGINPLIMAPGYPASVLMMGLGLQIDPNPPAEIGRGERTFADTPAYTEALQIIRDLEAARCFDGAEQAGVDAWSTGLAEFALDDSLRVLLFLITPQTLDKRETDGGSRRKQSRNGGGERFDGPCDGSNRLQRTSDHDHGNVCFPRGNKFGGGGIAAGIFGDEMGDAAVEEQPGFRSDVERRPLANKCPSPRKWSYRLLDHADDA